MLISHKHKFITIDIPKTGTRSLRESLVPLNIIDIVGEPLITAQFYQHDQIDRVKKQFYNNSWNWCEYYKFTIVRNPWARYFSFFKYFKEYARKFINKDPSIIWNAPEIEQGKMCVSMFDNHSDHEVIKNIIKNNPAQHEYYMIGDEIEVDYIAEFDNYYQELQNLCETLCIQLEHVQHQNNSSSIHSYDDVMTQEIVDVIYKKEKVTIDLQGYTYK